MFFVPSEGGCIRIVLSECQIVKLQFLRTVEVNLIRLFRKVKHSEMMPCTRFWFLCPRSQSGSKNTSKRLYGHSYS